MTALHPGLSTVAIIPFYNGARWIEQSIQSVLSQTLKPDEFIVVDDGSTDGGDRRTDGEAASHIKLLCNPNGGRSSARKFGSACCPTDLSQFKIASAAYKARSVVRPIARKLLLP